MKWKTWPHSTSAWKISSYRMEELASRYGSDVAAEGRQEQRRAGRRRRVAAPIGDLFFELFPRTEGRSNFDNRDSFLEVNRGAYSALANALMLLQTELSRVPERPEEINNMMPSAPRNCAALLKP